MNNRPIKFRAWLKEKGVMAEYVSHFKHSPDSGVFEITVPFDESGLQTFRKLHSIDEFDLMQFTGLSDKNGKEIYEGDIVHCTAGMRTPDETFQTDEVKEIRFEDGAFRYDGITLGDMTDAHMSEYTFEVVGNVFENPSHLNV